MSETKTYVFGENGNSNNSFDPNLLWGMMMGNGGFGGGFGGGNWMWPLFLLFLFGGNGFGGFGGNRGGVGFLSDQLNNTAGRDLLMQAIQGNNSAIERLSSSLGCSLGDIQGALNSLGMQISSVGNQVGLSNQQVINSLQMGNAQLANQIAQCCCDTKAAINSVNVGLERGFSSLAFETQKQTCDLEKSISNSTAEILAGQRAAEMRELQDKLEAARDKNVALQNQISQEHQTIQFGQMINQATAPLAGAIGAIQSDVDKIKCKLPETFSVPYQPFTAVPNCVAYGAGIGNGFPFGWNNGGSLWG